MRRRIAGYSLLEVVVSMAVFGIFLMILGALTMQMRRSEATLPVNFMRHPQIISVISRIRRDVQDAHGPSPYRSNHDGFSSSEKTLILEAVQSNGEVQIIVWDFRTPGEVLRRSYDVGVATEWRARGVPKDFSNSLLIGAVGIPGRPWGVRLTARDGEGRLAIDQILQPRAHE